MKHVARVQAMMQQRVALALVLGLLSGVTTQVSAEQKLYANQFLFYGQSIVDLNCRFRLTMESGGSLAMYDFNRERSWERSWEGWGAYAVMQTDGNFVMYDWSGQPLTASHTSGYPGAYLVMQDDGNLVVYKGSTPLFATNTVAGGERLASGSCASSSVTVTEPEWDRPGGDYIVYSMDAPEYAHCAYWCSQDSRCKAFTYVPPGVQSGSAMCWLKEQVPAASYRPGMVSGRIVR